MCMSPAAACFPRQAKHAFVIDDDAWTDVGRCNHWWFDQMQPLCQVKASSVQRPLGAHAPITWSLLRPHRASMLSDTFQADSDFKLPLQGHAWSPYGVPHLPW